jgi:hypothetical protein
VKARCPESAGNVRRASLAHRVHRVEAMVPYRTGRIALLAVLAMVVAPAIALAVHSRCEVRNHSCHDAQADVCCCDHVSGTESQLPIPANPVVMSVVAPQLTVSAAPSPRWSPIPGELVRNAVHLAIDRLILFSVFLI